MDYNVYIYENQINNKRYVGQTVRFKKRICEHKSNLRSYFQYAIKKHGWNNFKLLALMQVNSKEEMDELEMLMIEDLQTTDKSKGYNLTKGGEGNLGHKHSTETKLKLSRLKTGLIISEETKIKMSKAQKGRMFSGEARKKISEARTGISSNRGVKFSEEHKRKISLALKGRIISEEARIKMSIAWKKRTVSEETKKKMSLAQKLRWIK